MERDLKIVFLGTPEFAVASLDALFTAGFTIVGVITAPDKPAGRGMKLQESAVKKYAIEKGLKVLQPVKLKDPQFLEELKKLEADVQVVVAFRMLPEVVWNMPPLGTINVHASLLPKYRGAAPINWCIINGDHETGVTTFKLKHQIDTGNILLQERVTILPDETAGELHDQLKQIGANLLVKTLDQIIHGTIKEQPQEITTGSEEAVHAPKIFTADSKIDWNNPVDRVYNLTRGLSPYPAAFTYLDDKLVKIIRAGKDHTTPTAPPGKYVTDKKSYLKYACADGWLLLEEIQMEGKKKMMITDFVRGYHFKQ
jgi:methionyl-tRNA formyltransferase